jgi:pantothenate kinase-related protein Tda10
VARSGDDWYLGRAAREPLRALGYDPGVPGVTNRSGPGTHDLAWLRRNLAELERSTADSVIAMGNFDKRADDQPTGPDRYFEVHGRVGVFLFDLWFAGATTDVDPARLPDGLRRRVAEQLRGWGPVFDRMDALWSFEWPSFEQMVRDREAQEVLVERRRGSRGLSTGPVRAFMTYMVERMWDWQTTSPVPAEHAVTFRARRDENHRIIAVQRGGRAW